MKISKEEQKPLKKLSRRYFDEFSAYCCKIEDSSTSTTNFEAKYFGEKWKYDWEKNFEQYYSVEKSAINFIGEIGIIYNCENFSWKPLPFEFMGVHLNFKPTKEILFVHFLHENWK